MKQESARIDDGKMKPKCVLLVEDDRAVRRYLEVTLQRSGYQVLTAGDGLEAMKIALSAQVDVIITDAIMPHMSGEELARFFRDNSNFAKVPIVMLTGQEHRQAGAQGLVDSYLLKPVKTEELVRCLSKLLRS
ncbi:MAG TPA: response regulator [Pyrinomonadaceae bacterium]|nr:response regulator [Pyrinomonadaceae bacterium]